MAAQQPETGSTTPPADDIRAHERGYGAFLRMLKRGTIAAALLTAFVIYILVV